MRSRVAALVLALASATLAGCGDGSGDDGHRGFDPDDPNIVVVMTDDQAIDTMRALPFVRRQIGRRGAVFEQSIASFPLCCPSRATLLTGQYAHNHGVLDNSPPAGGLGRLDGEEILPVWLQRAGYRTALVGKYLNGYGDADLGGRRLVPDGWSDWYAEVSKASRSYEYTLNENGELVDYGDDTGDYKTDVLARFATEVVEDAAGDERPFFLWVTPGAPHVDTDRPKGVVGNPAPAPRHSGDYAGTPLPADPATDEADVSDKPGWVRALPRLGPSGLDAARNVYVSQLEALAAVDDLVHEVVAALRRAGELDRTVILFTSDNGFLRGQHRVDRGKSAVYEEAIRVPLLVRGPGFPQGERVEVPVANVDLAPTILDLAGAEPAFPPDGRSLLDAVAEPVAHRSILLEVFERKSGQFTGLRTSRYAFALRDGSGSELYDLRRDPDQLDNVAADPAYAGVRQRLEAELERLEDCAGEGCR